MNNISFASLSPAPAPVPDAELRVEWEPVVKAIAGSVRMNAIIEDAIARRLHTFEYTCSDLERWAVKLARQIGPGSWHGQAARGFRLVIGQPGLKNLFSVFQHNLQQLAEAKESGYLTNELLYDLRRFEIIRRREAYYSRVNLNPKTERDRIEHVHQLCRYAVEILHISPLVALDQVLTEPVISSWITWLHDVGKLKRTSLEKLVSSIYTMLIKHPDYWKQDLSWMQSLSKKFEKEPESVKAARKDGRSVDYRELLTVIVRMREERLAAKQIQSSKQVAWLVHDQLLFMFIVLAQWPAQCVLLCKVGGDRPNLFEGPLRPEDMPADLQPWAGELLKSNPEVPLWQFRFSSQEIPRRGALHGVVHNFLLPLLELYLQSYRSRLLNGKPDPGTLFFSRFGNRLSENALIEWFGRLTFKYGYSVKRVLPRNVPRIFGNYWERNHPGKYGELASIVGMRIPSVRAWFSKKSTGRGRAVNRNRR